jgi:hypothetical protein
MGVFSLDKNLSGLEVAAEPSQGCESQSRLDEAALCTAWVLL